ncbi:uncharacterized protein LOC126903803 isoform X2 [Daktulosphaira vitifoliae]|nr:uncharacterized protein LOC126903803 isoform X2 [Daktulosphaira vitifoliae]
MLEAIPLEDGSKIMELILNSTKKYKQYVLESLLFPKDLIEINDNEAPTYQNINKLIEEVQIHTIGYEGALQEILKSYFINLNNCNADNFRYDVQENVVYSLAVSKRVDLVKAIAVRTLLHNNDGKTMCKDDNKHKCKLAALLHHASNRDLILKHTGGCDFLGNCTFFYRSLVENIRGFVSFRQIVEKNGERNHQPKIEISKGADKFQDFFVSLE